MTIDYGDIPTDNEEHPVLALWDDATQKAIPIHIKSKVTGADGRTYAIVDTGSSGGGTQYTDGDTPPTNPVAGALMYDKAGVWTDVSVADPLPVNATITPPANQRVNAQANDFLTGSIVDLLTLLTLAGTSADANTVASLMGRLTKIRDLLAATLTITGAVTTSGTVTEANSAAILADTATIETNTGNIPPLGQALAAASVPVVLTAIQQTALTPPAAITNFANETGGNLAQLVTQLTELLTDADNLATIVTNTTGLGTQATLAAILAKLVAAPALESGNLATLVTNTADLLADGDNLATINTNTSTSATQNTSTATNTSTISTVTGAKTDTKATDGSTTAWSVIALLKGIFDKLLGSLAVTGTFWQATQPVSGTVTSNAGTNLNTSLLALEAGGNLASLVTNTADLLADGDHLATIDTSTANIPAKGTAVMSGSTPITVATDDTVFAEVLTDLDNLATIQTNTANIPAKGTAVMTGSSPVTIATNDTVFAELLGDTDNLATIQSNTSTSATQNTSTATNTSNTSTVLGATTDAAVVGDVTGSISAKQRGLSKILNDMWDSTNHWLQVKVMNGNANGQTTMSASAPVVIASDQTPIPIKVAVVAVYSLASTTSTGSTQNSGDLTVGLYREISIDINTTAQAGTSPTLQLFYERKAADGIYYVLWQSAVLTVAANTLSTSIGAGMAYNQSLGATGRLRWVVGGSATPTYTFSANIQGK